MYESFGSRFQRLRKQAGLTQEDVATKLNITAQAVSKWENDLTAPDISVLLQIAEMFHVTADELLGKEPVAQYVPAELRKPTENMMLRIRVLSCNGDKVNVNLPIMLVKILANSGASMPKVNDKDILGEIDFKQILMLVEQGLLGKLVDVESAEGDLVEIWVE